MYIQRRFDRSDGKVVVLTVGLDMCLVNEGYWTFPKVDVKLSGDKHFKPFLPLLDSRVEGLDLSRSERLHLFYKQLSKHVSVKEIHDLKMELWRDLEPKI